MALWGAVCILFAAEYLQRNFTPVVEENTMIIDVPKRGEAVTVDLVFGRLPGGDLLLGQISETWGALRCRAEKNFSLFPVW